MRSRETGCVHQRSQFNLVGETPARVGLNKSLIHPPSSCFELIWVRLEIVGGDQPAMGVALQILEDTVVLSSAQAANPRWLAPEVLQGQPATQCSVRRLGRVAPQRQRPHALPSNPVSKSLQRMGGLPAVGPPDYLSARQSGVWLSKGQLEGSLP